MITPALNPLVLSLKESATLAINLKAIGLREAGKKVHHFGFGQSPFPVPVFLFSPGLPYLAPFESSLFPRVNKPDHQNSYKYHHRSESEKT